MVGQDVNFYGRRIGWRLSYHRRSGQNFGPDSLPEQGPIKTLGLDISKMSPRPVTANGFEKWSKRGVP